MSNIFGSDSKHISDHNGKDELIFRDWERFAIFYAVKVAQGETQRFSQ